MLHELAVVGVANIRIPRGWRVTTWSRCSRRNRILQWEEYGEEGAVHINILLIVQAEYHVQLRFRVAIVELTDRL